MQNPIPLTNCDKVCANIGRLPLELRHAIFNCLTVDFRLEMVLQKTAHIIRTLYEAYNERILDITVLKRIVTMGIRWQFFYHTESNGLVTQPKLRALVPNLEFKQMGEIVSTDHPVFKALREIVVIPTIRGTIKSKSRRYTDTRHARDALDKIVSTIIKSSDILPTLTVPSGCIHSKKHRINCGDTFNYLVKKYTFHFIYLLTKSISKFKVPLENAAIEKAKKQHMLSFKRTIAKQIVVGFRTMQRKIKLSAKIAREEAKKTAKKAREEAKKAKEEAKKAREEAKVAKEEAKIAKL
jgi:hypothetical protein